MATTFLGDFNRCQNWMWCGNLSLEPESADVLEPGMTLRMPFILFGKVATCSGEASKF